MRLWLAGGVLLILAVAAATIVSINQRLPADLRVFAGQLAKCPERRSCVSSLDADDAHAVRPLQYVGDPAAALARLKKAVAAMPGASVEHEAADYLHAVFVTPLLKLRDDVEFVVQIDGTIQVRSCSRFAWDDRGGNRVRVDELRRRFDAPPGA